MPDMRHSRALFRTAADARTQGVVGPKIVAGLVAGAVGVWALDRFDWFMWNRRCRD
jgi:hypothetical protein